MQANTVGVHGSSGPLVSVVVTTRNEEANIANCLESLAHQSWPNIETIVVDNASTDRTKELARRYTDKVADKGPERSAQRNHGMIDMAMGEYVMYLDADMICSPLLVEACVRHTERSRCMALYVSEVVLGTSFWSRVRRFERSFYDGTVIDCARFMRRDVFQEVGGFDPAMSGPEDWDLDRKLRDRGRVDLLSAAASSLHMPSMPDTAAPQQWAQADFVCQRGVSWTGPETLIYHNEAEFNPIKYLSKKAYYVKSMDAYTSKWGADDPDVSRQLGLGYRFFGVFLERGKWRKLLAHPILGAGMYILRFMVGSVFLLRKLARKRKA